MGIRKCSRRYILYRNWHELSFSEMFPPWTDRTSLATTTTGYTGAIPKLKTSVIPYDVYESVVVAVAW